MRKLVSPDRNCSSRDATENGDQSGTSSKISVFQLLGRITSNSLKSRGLKQNKVFEKSRRVTVHIQCPYLQNTSFVNSVTGH